MADFNTHVLAAAATASFAATICTKWLNLPVSTALLLSVGGTIGGVLPDIDLKYSVPSKILFSILGAISSLIWLFAEVDNYSVLELWIFALLLFLLVRYPLWALFHQFTVHRGSLHSLIAVIMFGLLTAVVGEQVLKLPALTSWLLSAFVSLGALVHLTLDEIYSVDFMGVRIKRSFGSALKLLDAERLPASCIVLFICLVAWFWTPSLEELNTLWETERQMNKTPWKELLWPDYLR